MPRSTARKEKKKKKYYQKRGQKGGGGGCRRTGKFGQNEEMVSAAEKWKRDLLMQ